MANYNVTITNGTGSQTMQADTYSVSIEAQGYDPSTLTPKTYTATAEEGSGTFTVTATGTLTLTFNETGAEGGTPITAGSVVMTDATGTARYGTAKDISATGIATFNNVPYGTTDTPITLYFLQLSSDGTHNPFDGVITVSMTEQTQNQYVQNTLQALQTFTVTDATYTGLPVANATLNFTSNE